MAARFSPAAGLRVAGQAQQLARQVLTAWEITNVDTVDNCLLVVSELVTNALLHGAPHVELHLDRRDRQLLITVIDDDPHVPRPRHDLDAVFRGSTEQWTTTDQPNETGRGLFLVSALSDHWGAEAGGTGKRVTATIGLRAGHSLHPPG